MITNSAPEHFIPKSDAGGNLVESRFSDGDLDGGTNSHINNIVGPVRIGDCKDEGNGTLIRLSDIDKRVSVEVNLNGDDNSHLLMESAGAFLQVKSATRTVLMSLSSNGGAQLGTITGTGTRIAVDDSVQLIALHALNVEPGFAGQASLGTSAKPFRRLFLDSFLSDDMPGDTTINKAGGTVIFGSGASSLTVTNDLVSVNSLVFAVVRTNDATAAVKNVTVANGSFVIRLQSPATNATEVAFWVLN